MKSNLFVFLVFFALMSAGCYYRVVSPPEHRNYPPPVPSQEYPPDVPSAENPPEPRNPNFDARLEAAKSMSNFMQQDSALSSIAIDAANGLDIEHTLKAISMMSNFMTQDSTAEKCVTPFINKNMLSEAKLIADKINNFATQDRVLAKIAQGPK
jgi:hypothetical protein